MRIHVLSDLHLELPITPFEPCARTIEQADVIILAGDIGSGAHGVEWAAKTFLGKPVIYVLGNHEFYGDHIDDVANACKLAARGTNVRVLDNDATVINSVRFLGTTLWTDFELFGNNPVMIGTALRDAKAYLSDFSSIFGSGAGPHRFLTPEETIEFHQASKAWLARKIKEPFDGKTVVVTHHAPSFGSIATRYEQEVISACFASRLDDLAAHADLWIHGHTHQAFDYEIGKCRVVCNPRGYVFPARSGNRGEMTEWERKMLVEV